MKAMKLSIMYLDKRVEELTITRLFTMNTSDKGPVLYYETPVDMQGNGHSIPLEDIKCWETEAMEIRTPKFKEFGDKEEEPIQDVLGKTIYVMRVSAKNNDKLNRYSYRIYPAELTIKEVRIGKAIEGDEKSTQYGPGSVTWLCHYNNGYVQAFSPMGDEIISTQVVAGRQVRGFLDKSQLKGEAEILRKLVYQNYKNVDEVEVCLTDHSSKNLSEKIQSAKEKSRKALNENSTKKMTELEH